MSININEETSKLTKPGITRKTEFFSLEMHETTSLVSVKIWCNCHAIHKLLHFSITHTTKDSIQEISTVTTHLVPNDVPQ